MWVTPAYAQVLGGGGGGELLQMLLPFALIFVIMYFLILRPQRQQAKRREDMLKAIRRGDTVVTNGGIIGKVTKVVDDTEVDVVGRVGALVGAVVEGVGLVLREGLRKRHAADARHRPRRSHFDGVDAVVDRQGLLT